jgi:hypothetical protein
MQMFSTARSSQDSAGFFANRRKHQRKIMKGEDTLSMGSLEGQRVTLSQRKERQKLFSPSATATEGF